MPFPEQSSLVGFGFNPLNRLSEIRHDKNFIDGQRNQPSTRFFTFVDNVPVLIVQGSGFQPLFSHEQLAELGQPVTDIYLGRDETGASLFAAAFDADCAVRVADNPQLESLDLRSIALRGLVSPALLGELGGANAMLNWHRRHQFCSNCGARSRISAAGWRRDCDACGGHHFPRVDPVVIMLAIHGERCLLGRQPRFASGMYSALAGFLEPGETVEDAVRREIREESGISCSEVAYFASQPWPFPSSLMIGCFARALGENIVVDAVELEDARWFSRDEAARMMAGNHATGLSAPKPYAIAHHLLKAFIEDGPRVLS